MVKSEGNGSRVEPCRCIRLKKREGGREGERQIVPLSETLIIFLHLLRSRTFFAHVCDTTLHAQQVQCDVSLSLFK